MNIDQVDLRDIYEFMEKGNPEKAPEHIVQYLDLLDKVRGMYLRIDQFGSKDAIVKHLMVTPGLSRYKAAKVYDEALEYFYADSAISKAAWRNVYADKVEKMVHFAMLTVKDVNDAQKVVKMIADLAALRGLNEPDKEELPQELFTPPFIVYTCDTETLGLTKVDRNRLSKLIDDLPELSEKERLHIKREAMVLPVKIFPDEQEDARKS